MFTVFTVTFYRVEEYVSRGLEGNIVDPDESMMYTKRKLHQLHMDSTTTSTSMPSTSLGPSTQTKHTPKFPTDGWGTSSGKNVGGGSYHSLPTGAYESQSLFARRIFT